MSYPVDIVGTVLYFIALTAIPGILVGIFITADSWAERLICVVLLVVVLFYYASSFQAELSAVAPVAAFFQALREVVVEHFPRYAGVPLFGTTVLEIRVNPDFQSTYWPVTVFYVGGVIRVMIGKLVPNERLRMVAVGYWLFITGYCIISIVLSDVANWNFIGTFVGFLILLFFVLIGVFKVVGDIVAGIFNVFKIIGRLIWIGLQLLALAATRIAKVLRSIVQRIRELYNKYFLRPFQRLYHAIMGIEDKLEEKVGKSLRDESLDN